MNTESNASPFESQPVWNLGMIARVLRSKAGPIALYAIVFVALGIGYILITPTEYEAKTVVQVEQEDRPNLTASDNPPKDLKTPEILKTFEQNLTGGALLLRIFKSNHIDQDHRYLAERETLPGAVFKWVSGLFSSAERTQADASIIRKMEKRVKVKLRRGSRLIDVSVRAQDPEFARQLSQSIVDEFVLLDFNQKLESTKPAIEYLLKEAERRQEKLQKSQQLLQAYKEEHHAVSLEQRQNIVLETLKELNGRLSDARTTRIKHESDVALLETAGGAATALLSIASVASSPDVVTLKQRISQLQASLASLGQRYDTKSPKYMQADIELQKLQSAFEGGILDAARLVKTTYTSAKNTEQKLLEALNEQEKQALDLSRIAIEYDVLSREVAADEALYDAVLKNLRETQIVPGVGAAIRVVAPATLPDRAAWPRKIIILPAALLLGLMVGTIACIGPILVKAPFLDLQDAERQLGIPGLGSIPTVAHRRGPHHIFVIDHPLSPASDALRVPCSILSNRKLNEGHNLLLYTSAEQNEGKTFCALNSAAVFALNGNRTLLIDASLRSPSLSSRLQLDPLKPGLVDVLSGKAQFESAIQPATLKNLFLLTAGSPTDRPSELLAAPGMEQILRLAVEKYERVVLDTACVLGTSDTLGIASHIPSVCVIVARACKTPRESHLRTMQLLTSIAGITPAGIILNHARSSSAH